MKKILYVTLVLLSIVFTGLANNQGNAVSRTSTVVGINALDNSTIKVLPKTRGSNGFAALSQQSPFVRMAKKNEHLCSLGAPENYYFSVNTVVPGDPKTTAQNFIYEQKEIFGITGSEVDFSSKRSKRKNGKNYERFQQTYSQIPVYGAEFLVQLDDSGGVEYAFCDIMTDTSLLDDGHISTTPAISAYDAECTALEKLSQENPAYQLDSLDPKLMIFHPEVIGNVGPTKLIWYTEVKSTHAYNVDEVVLVDAHSGQISMRFSQIKHIKERQVYDSSNSTDNPGTLSRSEGEAPIGNQDVDDCYDYLGDTYDFYFNEHGRDSIDNAGMILSATVRFCMFETDCPMQNAFWNGSRMFFGEGFATDDITAHELTHGVTQYESNLIYMNESGAINESFSDMWGEWVDLTNTGGNDSPSVRWLLGEDIGAIRNMADPTQFQDPDSKCSPFWYAGSGDNGGVHTNSGVGNKLCYLLTDGDIFKDVEIQGMGISAAAELFYEVQTNLLIPASDYADLHIAVTQAAINLGWTQQERLNLEYACLVTELSKCFDPADLIDNIPPYPDPAEWASWGQPVQTGVQTIIMEAKRAVDNRGGEVEYYFECTTDSSFDSGWQSSTVYNSTGLQAGTEYAFRVRARDEANNITEWSSVESANTDSTSDQSPPFTDPPRWLHKPSKLVFDPPSNITLTMMSWPAFDESGVEYWFEMVTPDGNGGWIADVNSGWSVLRYWRPDQATTGFIAGNTYHFRFKVRDRSAQNNETAFSSVESVTLVRDPQVITVPGQYQSIQDAIDAAAPSGDIVVVSPGTYTGPRNNNLDFDSKKVTVRSTDPNNLVTVNTTIIDGSGIRRAFDFSKSEGPDSIVAGFTITNCANQGADTDTGDPNNPIPPGPGLGGAIIFTNNSSPTIKNCIINNCYAMGGNSTDPNGGNGADALGGALYIDSGCHPIIQNCDISGCYVQAGTAVNGSPGSAMGGAINVNSGANPKIIDCTITSCTADTGTPVLFSEGGGIYWDLSVATSSWDPNIITGTDIVSNYAEDDGGGIFFTDASVPVNLRNCRIHQNYVTQGDGGGIAYSHGNVLTISQGSVISENSADTWGGGIVVGEISSTSLDASLVIVDSQIRGNTAQFGGGIYANKTTIDVNGSDVSENIANEGAGINSSYSDVTIYMSDFNGNNADANLIIGNSGTGGALALWDSNIVITSCEFKSNVAAGIDGMGGGIYISGKSLLPSIITNCLVVNNEAENEGAGIFCHLGALVQLNNCTIADNNVTSPVGIGGGVACAEHSSYIQVNNSILWNNYAGEGPQIAVGRKDSSIFDPQAIVDVWYSDVQGGESDVYIEDNNPYVAAYFLMGNHDVDPLFTNVRVDESGNMIQDYYLSNAQAGQLEDSPLINMGDGSVDDLVNVVGYPVSTRTDHVADVCEVDMGYHYSASIQPEYYLLTITVDKPGNVALEGYLRAHTFDFDIIAGDEPNSILVKQGTVVKLTAMPNNNFVVGTWQGTDDDTSTDPCNTVLMTTDKNVILSFLPDGMFYLNTEVISGNGKIFYIDGQDNKVQHPGTTIHLADELVKLVAEPDVLTDVTHWTGTDNDTTILREIVIKIDSNRDVQVAFRTPDILHVPDDYTIIQTAIEEAQPGDIVKIAPGEYQTEYVTAYLIDGKPIVLTSEDPEDPCVVAETILRNGLEILNVDRSCRILGLTWANFGWSPPDGRNGNTPQNPLADGENGNPSYGVAILLHEDYVDIIDPPNIGSSPYIKNCVFRNISAVGSNGGNGGVVNGQPGDGGWGGWAQGAAISLGSESNPKIENCKFINCSVTGGDGGNGTNPPNAGRGGMWTQTYLGSDGWEYGPYVEFTRYTGRGGALYVEVNSTPEIINCEFTDCVAMGGASGQGGGPVSPNRYYRNNRYGGAVYCAEGSSPVFTGCKFTNNVADINGPAQWHDNRGNPAPAFSYHDFLSYGGAVAFAGSSVPTFIDCNFTNNSSTIGGGMYWADCNPELYNCDFNDNTAYHGGGILCIGGSGRIDHCRFTSNSASFVGSYGGAVASIGADTHIIDSQMIDNYANAGAGMYTSSMNIIDPNSEEIPALNKITIRNCLFADNKALSSGAGLSVNWHSYADIDLCTFADNAVLGSGPGGGVESTYGSFVSINDSIIWNNSAGNGRQIAVYPEATPAAAVVEYSNVEGGGIIGLNVRVDTGNIFDYAQNTNINDDPLFVSSPVGDYFLSQKAVNGQNQDSPCIDIGSDFAIDLGMNERTTRTDQQYDRGLVDMGFHYPFAGIDVICKVCDLLFDGKITLFDLDYFALRWLNDDCREGNNWCEGADFNFDTNVDLFDHAYFAQCWQMEDKTPPIPNPSTWYKAPAATHSGIEMHADAAWDAWWGSHEDGYIEYYFKCTSDSNFDSGWIDSNSYEPPGLVRGQEYTFKVKARDGSGNETVWSNIRGVKAGDPVVLVPDPLTWAQIPVAISESVVRMEADQVTGASPIEYLFINQTTGEDSGWQSSAEYEETGLTPNTQYTYVCVARHPDSDTYTTQSEPITVTTPLPGVADVTPPIPLKASFDSGPVVQALGDGYYHTMTAVTATEEQEGGTPPVWYKFYCEESGFNSGWQLSPTYSVRISTLNQWGQLFWQVQTRDSVAPFPNVGQISDKRNAFGQVIPVP